jgi:lactate dehydrogenase-like 2-hydroxyacid dehydrogenase
MSDTPVILQTMAMPPRITERLGNRYDVLRLWEAENINDLIEARGSEVRAVLTMGHGKVDAAMIDALTNLEMISVMGVGYDGVDVRHALAKGAPTTNTPGVLSAEVANLAIGLVLSVTREIPKADAYVRDGRWLKADLPLNKTIVGRPIGVVALGGIGLAVADRLTALGAHVTWTGPRPKPDAAYPFEPDIARLAEQSDGLVLCCPGGPSTRHLINRKVLNALGPDGWIVNVARGSVIDEQALVEALMAKRIWGAGLDVFEAEPKVPSALFDLDNVVLQPHQASATVATRNAMADLAVENLDLHFAGKPLKTPVKV